jgi:pyridoxine 5'-phosphate synthase PdxJ
MNFQEKLIEAAAELRTRANHFADAALNTARARSGVTAKRVELLKGSFAALTVAGRELNKVARRHAVRFVKENATIATAAGKDVSALARSTYAALAKRGAVAQKSRNTRATAKRKSAKSAA